MANGLSGKFNYLHYRFNFFFHIVILINQRKFHRTGTIFKIKVIHNFDQEVLLFIKELLS